MRVINEGDESQVEAAVLQLSQRKRIFAPLTFAVGALLMLFTGVKLLFSDWRLFLIQVVPAMWISVRHAGPEVARGGPERVQHLVRADCAHCDPGGGADKLASFYLNAVFAFAISSPGKPAIGRAFASAWGHLGVVAAFGSVVGLALGFSAVVVPRWGLWWFALSMSIVVGVMMLTYVTVPSRLVGIKASSSRRDKLTASVSSRSAGGHSLYSSVCPGPGRPVAPRDAYVFRAGGAVAGHRAEPAVGRHRRGEGNQGELEAGGRQCLTRHLTG